MGIVIISVQKGFDAIEVPNTSGRLIVNPEGEDSFKEAGYQNIMSSEESSKNYEAANTTNFIKTFSDMHRSNGTLENNQYNYRGTNDMPLS